MNEQELNEKLTEWAECEKEYDRVYEKPFTQSLDACFEWLVPKLPAPDYIKFRIRKRGYMCEVRGFGLQVNAYYYESPALALCNAIEKLIDGGT